MLRGLLLRMPRGLVCIISLVIKEEPGTNYGIVRGKPCSLKECVWHRQMMGTDAYSVTIEEHGDDYYGNGVAQPGKTADGILRSLPCTHVETGELWSDIRHGERLSHILDSCRTVGSRAEVATMVAGTTEVLVCGGGHRVADIVGKLP